MRAGLQLLRLFETATTTRCSSCGTRLLTSLAVPPHASTSDFKGKAKQNSTSSSLRRTPSTTTRPRLAPAVTTKSRKSALSQLEQAISIRDVSDIRTALSSLTPADRGQIDRFLFDNAFTVLSGSNRPKGITNDPIRAWGGLKYLRELAAYRQWELLPWQKRIMFEIGVRWEEMRRVRNQRLAGKAPDWEMSREKEEERASLLTTVWSDYVDLDKDNSKSMSIDDLAKRSDLLERYALIVYKRGVPDEIFSPLYTAALAAVHPHEPPKPSPVGSYFFEKLIRNNPTIALAHLDTMIRHRRTLTNATMLRLVNETGEDFYETARTLLDSAKDPKAFDALYERRIAGLDRSQRAEELPSAAFVRWLALERVSYKPTLEPPRSEWLRVGLSLWDTIFDAEIEHKDVAYQVLAQLIKEVCALEEPAKGNLGVPQGSTNLRRAVELATSRLPAPHLPHLASLLLRTICRLAAAPALAIDFYVKLRNHFPPSSVTPFRWSASQTEDFTFLVHTADRDKNARLVLQLYSDWTGDGLYIPSKNVWAPVFRAAGRRAQLDEIVRIVADFEANGRSEVSQLIGLLVTSACDSTTAKRPHQIFKYLHDKGYAIPFPNCLDVLRFLARAVTDCRAEAKEIFDTLSDRPVVSWNVIVAGNVFRPRLSIADAEAAEAAYWQMMAEGAVPDRMTYTLLMHGLLRLANYDIRGRAAIMDALVKTVDAAFERKMLPKGHQVATFALHLAKRGRWDQAKTVCERWWRLAETVDDQMLRAEMEMEDMRRAGELIVGIEAACVQGDEVSEGVRLWRQSKEHLPRKLPLESGEVATFTPSFVKLK